MNESTPWRALEEPVGSAVPVGGAAGPAAAGPAVGSARWLAMGGLGLAGLLLAGAIVLVVTSGTGAIAVEGGGAPRWSGSPGAVAQRSGASATADGIGAGVLIVDVQGAVARPGVVRLPAGSRVGDAIEAAGGYGPRVAADRVGLALNLAAELRDGDQVIVPSRDDPAPGSGTPPVGGSSGGTASGAGPVNLNVATAAVLDALPGIGPVTAAKIIAARDEQPFASLDDLRTRKVLGAATLEKIKDLVVVR